MPQVRQSVAPGDRIGDLEVLDVLPARSGHTLISVRCACSWTGLVRLSDARRRMVTCNGHAGGRPVSHPASYAYAHHRVRWTRGPAGDHACVTCGRPAEQWALDYGAHHAEWLAAPEGTFSLDVTAYVPMCKRCHWAVDSAARRLAVQSGWVIPKRIRTSPAPPRQARVWTAGRF